MRKVVIPILVIISLLVISCHDDLPDLPEIDYSYLPLDTGSWIEYEIQEITYANKIVIDSSSYQLKEIIESIFTDNENREAFRVERYYRTNDTMSWEIRDVWTINQDKASIQKVEENIRYVKLRFPVKTGKSWDGNIYNIYDEMEYEITNVDQTENFNGVSIDKVLTVTQVDNENLIEKQYFVEKYGKDVGLVYKIMIDIGSQDYTMENMDSIMLRIEDGTIFTQSIIDYSNNH